MTELYKKYRPKTLKGMIGNESTVEALANMLQRGSLPHALLFKGPSGCGKTTLARILKTELDCSDMDFIELNCSDFRGIETVREIRRTMTLRPAFGKCKIYLLDEAHQMSKDGQNALLKILEDTPEHIYFFICTTDPQKLITTIVNRCTDMPVEFLGDSQLKKLILRVRKREKKKLSQSIAEDIIDASNGSARACLVLLDKVLALPPSKRANAIRMQEDQREGIELCRALFKRSKWTTVANLIKELKGDPESLRWAILGYAKAVLLNKQDHYAYHIITCFEEPFYNSKEAGLARACYESLFGEQ